MNNDGLVKEDIVYYSDGLKIAAHLYRPIDWKNSDPPRPAIICLSGYSGRKNIATIDMPQRLSREGFFTLAPDYRGYGDSEGAPGRHRPLEQAQDTYDGVTYLETIPGVDEDRIGVYGSSFGGANAVWAAAFDERLKVVVSSVGVHDGERWLKSVRTPYDWFRFRDMVRTEARKRVITGEKTTIKRDDIYPPDPDLDKPKWKKEEQGSEEVTELDLESVEACFRYKADWVVDRISPRPVLFIYAEYDIMSPPEETTKTYERCGEPKKLLKLPNARHNHVYEFSNSEHFQTAARETASWFKHYL